MGKSEHSVIPPAYAGVSFLLSWIYLTFYARSAGIEAAAPISLYSAGYTLSASCMVMTLVVLAFSPRLRSRFLTRASVKAVTPGFMSLGTLLLILGGANGFTALTLTGSVLTGLTSGVMAQQWVVAYSRMGLKTIICSFPVLLVTCIGACMTLMYLPQPMLFLAMIAFPVVSELMFHAVRKSLYLRCDIEAGSQNRPLNFALLLLPIVVFALATGFMDFFSGAGYYAFVFYALVSIIPFGIAGVFIFVTERSHFFVTFAVPACFLLAVLVPFFSLFNLAPLVQCVSIGELGTEVILFVVTVGFAEFFELDTLKTYALGRAFIVVFNAAGWYLAAFVEGVFGDLVSSQALLLLVFSGVEVMSVCLVVAAVKTRKGLPSEASQEEGVELGEPASIPVVARAVAGGRDEGARLSAQFEHSSLSAGGVVPLEVAQDMQGADALSEQVDPAVSAATPSTFTIKQRCCAIGEKYGLSNREVDVAILLAQGYSSARIQSELYIAAGTVNYHTRNIYAKLGVHSKQEVIDLVGAWSDR